MKNAKKLFIALVLLGIANTAWAVTIVDNSHDGVHDGMSSKMTELAMEYVRAGATDEALARVQAETQAYFTNVVGTTAPVAIRRTSDGGIALGCSNAPDMIVIHLSEWDPGYIAPPPPPCTYISSYSFGAWSSCNITSQWSPSGVASCSQSRGAYPNYTTLAAGCPGNAAYPSSYELNRSLTISLGLDSANTSCSDKTANASDACRLSLKINGAPAEGVSGVSGSANSLAFSAPIYLDQTTKTGVTGGLFLPAAASSVNNYGIVFDNIKSAVPFSERGNFAFNLASPYGNTRITLTNIPLEFKRPFTSTFTKVGAGDFYIGTQQRLKLAIANSSNIPSYTTKNLVSTLNTTDANYLIQNINGETNLTNASPELNLTVNYKGTSKIGKTGLQATPQISYNLAGFSVNAPLNSSNDPDNRAPVVFGQTSFAGVKVVGNLPGSTRANLTGQDNAIVDVSLITLRPTIRQNAANITRGMKNGEVVNGVKYVEGDFTLSTVPNYKTLVVKNGDLTIASNVVSPIGIIVVSDSATKGHVYIKPNVQYIHALVYADGSMESVNSVGAPYTTDSTTRTAELQNQLVLKGGLYTKNTIGGAIFTTKGKYLLPNKKETDNLNEAIRYDLNYIRRGNLGYNISTATQPYNQGYSDPFVIISDTSLQKNPPKGFGQ